VRSSPLAAATVEVINWAVSADSITWASAAPRMIAAASGSVAASASDHVEGDAPAEAVTAPLNRTPGGPVRARSADTHSTDSHAEPRLSGRHDPLPEVYVSITPVETAAPRCQRSGVSIEVSPNSPRSAKSTASETPGGGGSAAGGTSSGA
jgi:hypothetical protein